MNPSPLGPAQELSAGSNSAAPPEVECAQLLQRLQQRYSRVVYRPQHEVFEIGDVLLLSYREALALLDHSLTAEEITVYRSQPEHVLPPRVRRALCRTSPWM